MKIILSHTDVNLDEWQRFVSTHPQSAIFHTPEYYFAFQTNEYAKTHLVVILSDKDEILALSVFIIYKEKGIKRYFSRRAVAMAPPIIKDNDENLLSEILQIQNKYLRQKVIYAEIRNINANQSATGYNKNKYQLTKHLNIVIDLLKPLSAIESDFYGSARNKIRRAGKNNLHFVQSNTEKSISQVYNLLYKLYDRIKYPLLPYPAFAQVVNYLSKQKRILTFEVLKDNKLLSTMVLLNYKQEWYSWYMVSSREEKLYGATDFLVWNILQEAKKQGIGKFDWGGAGNPDTEYGVRNFKKKFGGELIEQYRAICVYSPVMYYFSKAIFKIYLFLNKQHAKK